MTATTSYAIGDLDGDGISEIAATIYADPGGTGDFVYLAVFKKENGVSKYIDSQELGDRIQINKISIQNGIISADIITQGPGEPMCCGTLREVLRYKLSGNSLVEVAGDN